ncbi:hypothetical protein PI124_g22478 [Phytophthora idaei]|nr:hypothetical protein PI125_g25338 [Phytophthora idaei]KAG3126820.1 hypothetical protein PI126_g22154 [Phytophthora idaei]KAG3232440.1 hypothetical protein PI124_g22478 [Phytophthora idaei]
MEYERGAENQPMDGNPFMRGPSESATHIARADCPHLPAVELVQLGARDAVSEGLPSQQ